MSESKQDKFLLLFEDGTTRQCDEWDGLGGYWEQSVDSGLLEVIRFFEDEYQRYFGNGEWRRI